MMFGEEHPFEQREQLLVEFERVLELAERT